MDYNESKFAEYLNEIYGEVEICGMPFMAGDVLFEVDPTAFRTGQHDWEDRNETEEEK